MDRAKFYQYLRRRDVSIFGTSLSQTQVNNLEVLLDEAMKRGLRRTHAAYALATAYHEVGSNLTPRTENLYYTSASRIREVWPSRFKSNDAARPYVRNPQRLANKVYSNRMGNGAEASGDGWRYIGRGYPQQTGKDNYRRLSPIVGIDLVRDPDRMLEPRVAAMAMMEAMKAGLYTGKKFSDYLDGPRPLYAAARAIINPDVKANGGKIYKYAVEFEEALKAAGYPEKGYMVSEPRPRPITTTPPVAKPVVEEKPIQPAPAKPKIEINPDMVVHIEKDGAIKPGPAGTKPSIWDKLWEAIARIITGMKRKK